MTRVWWGWGVEEKRVDAAALGPVVRETLGFGADAIEPPVRLDDVALAPPRIATPWSSEPRDRIVHAYGASYRDTVRAFRGRIDHPPDAVAHPRTEADVERVLEWAAGANAAVVPFGGGTSVVGGVECPVARGLRRASSRSTSPRWRPCSRSIPSRAAPGSRRGSPARRSSGSSPRTG
jgi:alkyldihydroxyacetonephosphate synthase